jgi:nucleoid-associated protein YgaU
MADAVYTVQPADETDGLLGIAQRLYGDATRWPEIYDANQQVIGNNPNAIHSGQQLALPNLAAHGRVRIHKVQPSDLREGLLGIAQRLYGDATRWPEIHAVNKGVIGDNPHSLQAGQNLIII